MKTRRDSEETSENTKLAKASSLQSYQLPDGTDFLNETDIFTRPRGTRGYWFYTVKDGEEIKLKVKGNRKNNFKFSSNGDPVHPDTWLKIVEEKNISAKKDNVYYYAILPNGEEVEVIRSSKNSGRKQVRKKKSEKYLADALADSDETNNISDKISEQNIQLDADDRRNEANKKNEVNTIFLVGKPSQNREITREEKALIRQSIEQAFEQKKWDERQLTISLSRFGIFNYPTTQPQSDLETHKNGYNFDYSSSVIFQSKEK